MADTVLAGERAAIIAIRERNPNLGSRRLATRITRKDFPIDTPDYRDCVKANVPTRTLYSVYSVLRRYAAKVKAAASAGTGTLAAA